MALSPESAGIVIASILGLAGVVITAILSKHAEDKEQAVCPLHSGLVADIQAIRALLTEVRTDVKGLIVQRKRE